MKILNLRRLILFSLLILPVLHFAQDKKYYFEKISIPDGLSNMQVWDIVQDKYGFLWVATQDGLNRYDGYKFKVFKNDPEDKSSLPSNLNFRMIIDKDGTLWIGTQSGLCRYNRTSDSFTTFLVDSNIVLSGKNYILKILEDSKNRMWIGTGNGIYLFDRNSNKFEQMYIKKGDNKSPTVRNVLAILESSSGDIYSNNLPTGLIKFNEKTRLFEDITVPKSKKWNLIGQPIINFFEDKTGKIWICHMNGLFTYDTHTKIFDKINLNGSKSNLTVADIYMDDEGFLWISSIGGGIFRYNLRNNKSAKLHKINFPQGVNENDPIFKFYKDNFGVLWAADWAIGLLKLDFQKEPFRLYEKPGGNNNSNNNLMIKAILKSKSKDSEVWLGTNNGFFSYDLSDKSFKKYINKKGDKKSLPSNIVNSIVQIDEDGLWLGTDMGLSYFDISSKTFSNYYLVEQNNHYYINYNFVNHVTPDDFGNLWLSTGNGLVKFNTRTKSSSYTRTNLHDTYPLEILSKIDSLYNNNLTVSSILKVRDFQNLKKEFTLEEKTNLLIVSVGEGISSMVDYGWLTDINNDTLFIQEQSVENSKYLSGDFKNRIFIKTVTLNNGNYILNYKSDDSHAYGEWNADAPIDSAWWGIQAFRISDDDMIKINSLIKKNNNNSLIDGNLVEVAKYTKDGNLILGNNNGFSKYFISQNKTEKYKYDDNVPLNSNNTNINDIFIDDNNVIWLATKGGLIRYDPKTNLYNIFYDKDGLPSNYLRSIQADNFGNLWISTLNGISKFNKDIKNPIFINYDVKDGLQSYIFEKRSSYKGKNGELFFGGINGFNAFHSGNINKQPPLINISEMRINNKIILPNSDKSPLRKSILDTKDIVLNYSQNNISFDFNSIHFSRPEKNKYAYKMEGFDEGDWIYTDRKFASYTNLPEGDYVFKVKGSNGDGIWNETGTSINIKVLPPWYRTYWAYGGYLILFIGIIYGVDRLQRRRVLLKAKEKMKVQAAELRAVTAESQAKVIQAENERKTKELEEARQLQLSMLPKDLPKLPNLDIAVYMKTATEVGGDYYDFHIGLDGTLTVVVGDATGHGMKAGTMVTTTKSLFNVLAPNPNIIDTFHEITRCLKLMHLQKLSMCMTMIKIIGNRIQMSAAGMPPVLIYKRDSQSIEEHVLKGMPLGTFSDFPYSLIESELNSGDTILLMSDGFPELFNDKKEMFGYKRARNLFEELSNDTPENIIAKLKNAGSDWVNDEDPDDDVTFVVIKVK